MVGDQWIYVGKANNSLHERIRAHAKEERFQPYLESCKISYFEFGHSSDMTHAEAALIKIKKPVLNISGKNDSYFPFFVDADVLQWVEYKSPQEIKEEKKRKAEEEKRKKEEEKRKKIERIQREKREYELSMRELDLRFWCKDYLEYVEAEAKKTWARELLEQVEVLFGKPCDSLNLTLSPSGNPRIDDIRILTDRSHSENLYSIEKDKEKIILIAKPENAVRIIRNWTFVEASAFVSQMFKSKYEEKMKKYGLDVDGMFDLYEKTKEELAACA